MPTNARKLRVFICHSSKDKPIVRELYQRLASEGWIDLWLDEEKLLPGQDWDMEIKKAVEAADVVVVCLSKDSVNKEGYLQREIRFALDIALEKPEGSIFIIPLRFENCDVPYKLKRYQYLDYFKFERIDLAYARLLRSLEVRARDLGISNLQYESLESCYRAKLSFIGGKKKIFLIAKTSLTFGLGKRESCPQVDVTLRVLPVRSKVLDNENWQMSAKISKVHGCVRVRDGKGFEIIDLSQNGIYIRNAEKYSLGDWVRNFGTQSESEGDEDFPTRLPKGSWLTLPDKVEISLGMNLLNLEFYVHRDNEQYINFVVMKRLSNTIEHEYIQLVRNVVISGKSNGRHNLKESEAVEFSVSNDQYQYRYISEDTQINSDYRSILPGEVLKIGSEEFVFDVAKDSDFTELE